MKSARNTRSISAIDLAGHPAALEADAVHRADARAVALDDAERRHVALDHRAGGDEGALADAHELRDAREPAEGRVVLDDHVARELHRVGERRSVDRPSTSCATWRRP